ncbi:MAG: PTS IIA-like nitrogen regulatory protein PtsN [Acidiferrobacterales bacterium]|jgi:PTS system nitrogen regulatory IIA component|nr:PTS IIA-like nitrogen regulatory protein PtsN [Acidiferrobacterales bacterium]
MRLHELLTEHRIDCAISAGSKKRLLEKLSELLQQDAPEVDSQSAFQSLFDRERLGSTGVGNGVALPHGRMAGLPRAIGAFAILAEPMDYESVDNQPVKLVFALLVPEEATEEHLQLLAQLAKLFSKEENREQLLNARSCEDVYNFLRTFDSGYQQAS